MQTLDVRAALLTGYPSQLVDALLEAYREMKNNLYLTKLRPTEVEGGRFAEAAFRMLEHRVLGKYTPIGKQLDTDGLIRSLAQVPAAIAPDSVRLHIPRTLRVIYDVRSKRNAVHLGDSIDPNIQDASLVAACIDWILAEFFRLHHGSTPEQAQAAIEMIVVRKAPVIQEFGGELKTLRPNFSLPDRILVLLYHKREEGASSADISRWVKPGQRRQVPSALSRLEHQFDFVHRSDGRYMITRTGEMEVERRMLLDP